MLRLIGAAVCAAACCFGAAGGAGAVERPRLDDCSSVDGKRTICADVSAFDQTLVYNRFGSFNPFGMVFALTRDLSAASEVPQAVDADQCAKLTGAEPGVGELKAGEVRLKDCKRPRPLVLRARAGDILKVRLRNLLRHKPPGFSETFCRQGRASGTTLAGKIRQWVSEGSTDVVAHHEAACVEGSAVKNPAPDLGDWPRERRLNFAIQGLTLIREVNSASQDVGLSRVCAGLDTIAPDDWVDCYYAIDREGPYFIASTAAPSGGEGDGGSITHGLFGAVVVERVDTNWYRSQVSSAAFEKAWAFDATKNVPHARTDVADITRYEVKDAAHDNVPVLNILKDRGGNAHEIVHSDLNAIVHRDGVPGSTDPKTEPVSFREFSVFFHDELQSFTTRNFDELDTYGQLAGVRDGFAINYGASGMGTLLLANRKGIGPAAKCAECLYEEFFLASWANGDPALLEGFPDDPSNVHHSYLNDAVVFRNFHAGPKETHVFHLHAHQWFSGNDRGRGSYLDSQTVGPQQGFTYDIYDGGLKRPKPEPGDDAWDASKGSGNRNRTLGDSIFHCHLYPHFAQGMWELWRVHDVLEDGTRVLPDGQLEPGLSLVESDEATKSKRRPGSVDPITGKLYRHAAGDEARRKLGTPIPALVPLPGQAWPLLPTYPAKADGAPDVVSVDPDNPPNPGSISLDPANPTFASSNTASSSTGAEQQPSKPPAANTMPGYPFYIAGRPGHRPPQAPMDLALAAKAEGPIAIGEPLDGGLPRHVVTDEAEREFGVKPPSDLAPLTERRKRERQQAQYVAKVLAMGDMTAHMPKARLNVLPHDGTPLEKAAMGFHYNGDAWAGPKLKLNQADGGPANFDAALGGYNSLSAGNPSARRFQVNASPPKPGAPFADPCGVERTTSAFPARIKDPFLSFLGKPREEFWPDPKLIGFRRYEGSAVQLDLVTNRAGWHDPQARINVLTALSDRYKDDGGADDKRKPAAFSPRVSASEEPFFFRALSGECIEFRHTNELPKDLALDDFQMKTPTDTIGQHIHLVKFDVTSSDGSGNGFNYEDGTFAPDEVAGRICAAKTAGMKTDLPYDENEARVIERDLCEPELKDGKTVYHPKETEIWRKSRSKLPHRFQTTVQRWFADPILSEIRTAGDPILRKKPDGSWEPDPDKNKPADRTLRTVFTHDHFGPSSIQQHGFYSALIIEPSKARVCDPGDLNTCVSGAVIGAQPELGREPWVGAKKVIGDPENLDPKGLNFREFALAIADFATLYDPRDSETEADLLARLESRGRPGDEDIGEAEAPKGLAALYCELKHADDPATLKRRCGSAIEKDQGYWFGGAGDTPPAWVAARMTGDKTAHSADLLGSLIGSTDRNKIRDHLIEYRRKAAGFANAGPNARLAKPVNPPQRPESISVDHHDPYLVNYRGEPLPLRAGESASGQDCVLKPLKHWVAALSNGVTDKCSVDRQKTFPAGDMANVFMSSLHGDPATHVMETYTSDRVMFRLIQGAQEVQHTFTLEGYEWPRNIEQRFPSAARPLDDETPPTPMKTLSKGCEQRQFGGFSLSYSGRPDEYAKWFREGASFSGSTTADQDYWNAYETYLANCLNAEGRVAAQEVGISEHFEFAGAYRNDVSIPQAFVAMHATPMAKDDSEVENARKALIPTDMLQHFGSVDSLWNGAWSLLRIYKDDSAVDPEKFSACRKLSDNESDDSKSWDCLQQAADAGTTMGKRLPQLPKDRPVGSAAAAAPAGPAIAAAARPATAVAIECRFGAPIVHAALVAVETQRVFPSPLEQLDDKGTPYGRRLYDRNGLFMALVDPRKVARQNKPSGLSWTDWLSGIDAWTDISADKVIETVGDSYARPEPFALHVNAGDCVKLTVINALRPHTADPERPGLMDDLGDAPMPMITPLNVEPGWSAPEPIDDSPASEEKDGPRRSSQENEINLRPSARLALNLPLPVLNHNQDISRPFGWNRLDALAGTRGAKLSIKRKEYAWRPREANIEQLSFYAGRAGIPADFDAKQYLVFDSSAPSTTDNPQLGKAKQDFVKQVREALPPQTPLSNDDRPVVVGQRGVAPGSDLFAVGRENFDVKIDGKNILTPAPDEAARKRLDRLWDIYVMQATSAKIHWIPYAFGALPLKSAGDVIGHAVHGLFGAVVVHPRNAKFTQETSSQILEPDPVATGGAPCLPETGENCAFVAKPAGAKKFKPWVAAYELSDDAGAHNVRFVSLFWQDGLNLRDMDTHDKWRALGLPGPRLVADCKICDDSYDWGEAGVNYRSAPFHIRLRKEPTVGGGPRLERHFNLNALKFGRSFFLLRDDEIGPNGRPEMVVARAGVGEEVVLGAIHPGGRARQRSLVTIGHDYDDLFPSFGFPHSALLAPGKAVTAAFTRPVVEGCSLWFDGPTQLRASGTWGLLDVVAKDKLGDLAVTSCKRPR